MRADARRRSPAWSRRRGRSSVEEIAAIGTAGLRIAPNSAALIDAVREPTAASRSRSSPARRRPGWPTSRRFRRSASDARLAGRLRHRRRQLAVHVRPRGPRRRALQRGRRRGPAHGALRPRRHRRRGALAAALDAIAADLARLDGRPAPESAGRDGRRRHEPRRGQARARDLRPATSSTARSSTAPRSTGRSSSTAPATADERRAIVGLQPKRAEVILAGACIVRTVLAKLGRESLTVSDPRPATRPPRRAVRSWALSAAGREERSPGPSCAARSSIAASC